MSEIDKHSSVPIYRQVKQYLLDYIRVNYDSPAALPTEVSLSAKFGISRSTVRTAILELVNEGILERVPGKGTFIRENPNALVFANWLSAEEWTAPAVLLLIQGFMEETCTSIKSTSIPYEQIERQLMILATGGRAPDIASLIYLWLPDFVYHGALCPMDDLYSYELKQDLYPQALRAVTYKDRLYAFNWGSAPNILYFNRQLLHEYTSNSSTIDLEYYDSLLESFVKIHERSRGAVIPFSIPILEDELFFLDSIYHFLHSFGGGLLSPTHEVIFHCEENIKAFTWLKQFIRRGHINTTNSFNRNRMLFANNQIAFIIEGPWMRRIIPALNSEYETSFQKIGYSVLPKGPKNISCSVLWNHTLAVFNQCRNRDLAFEFIRYLVLNRKAQELYYNRTGMLPVQISELNRNPAYQDDFCRVLKKQMETAFTIPIGAPPFFKLAIFICAKAARDILLGDEDIPSTLNSHATIIQQFYGKRS